MVFLFIFFFALFTLYAILSKPKIEELGKEFDNIPEISNIKYVKKTYLQYTFY